MTRRPDIVVWHLDRVDRFGRRVLLTRNGPDEFTVEIEPSSQRDEGERIHHLNRALILELAEIVSEPGCK